MTENRSLTLSLIYRRHFKEKSILFGRLIEVLKDRLKVLVELLVDE